MGIPTLISTCTADGDDECVFTSGIDSTYDEYMFVMTNLNPGTNERDLQIQFNVSGGSGYNETITSTVFRANHNEADDSAAVAYITGADLAQGTTYQTITSAAGGGADECVSGVLHLFSPSSTTYVKHFYCRTSSYGHADQAEDQFTAGYINVTAAIDEVAFEFGEGVFDGVIQMFGIA